MAANKIPSGCYVIGESRTNADNAITRIYGSFYMAFEVDLQSGLVLAFNCTHTLPLTEDFLRRLFLGERFPEIDSWLEETLRRCYSGSSRRAILSSYRDALKRYQLLKKNLSPED